LIRIAISLAAYEAIKSTLASNTTLRPPQRDERGDYLILLEEKWLNALGGLRGPGESYGDVILSLAGNRRP
jgi:hypothetical protein